MVTFVVRRRIVWRHAVRNALAPLVVNLGNTLSVLIAGALVMLTSLLLMLGNIVADLLLAWIDPRTVLLD